MIQKIEPQSGVAFTLNKGEQLKIIDSHGEQVSDLVVFNKHDIHEKISSGKTMDFEESILISSGNYIWSNRSNKMLHILEDTNGRNDFLLAPCSPETFQIMYNNPDYHPSCFENLFTKLAIYDIKPDDIPTAFNVFMNVVFDANGKIKVLPPTSKSGDYVLFEAQMDLIVGMTACSAEDSNGGTFKPIHYEIIK
ncbi:MAG: urea carboxylase-associated family protein [Bacteroidetes bacterium]|nr:urea carboxylase-associated family protein [Bacteroidota bacterium]